MTYKKLTQEEEDYIAKKYQKLSDKVIAKVLGRTAAGVQQYRQRAGLLKSKAQGQFPQGHSPWNKGKQVDYQVPEHTKFQPGHQPWNTRKEGDGAITIRNKYNGEQWKYIRVSLGKWMPYHRYMYEQHYGPIPKGYIVSFIDGDPMNCELDNLQLLSRAENIKRNLNRDKAASNLKKAYSVAKAYNDYGLTHGKYKRLQRRLKREGNKNVRARPDYTHVEQF